MDIIIDLPTAQRLEKFIQEDIWQIHIDDGEILSELLTDYDKFKILVQNFLNDLQNDYQKHFVLFNLSEEYHKSEKNRQDKLYSVREKNSSYDLKLGSELFNLPQIEKINRWIESELQKYKTPDLILQPAATDKATHKQQMLILHYLGVIKKINLLTQKKVNQAKLISYLLNRSEKNTKTFIETMNLKMADKDKDVAMTPKNLEFVYNLFTDIGLIDLANKVQKDLEKASREK